MKQRTAVAHAIAIPRSTRSLADGLLITAMSLVVLAVSFYSIGVILGVNS